MESLNLDYKESAKITPLEKAPEERISLWYKAPATHWEEGVPVGNGRLGGMVYGGVSQEIIQFNEESIWAGPPVPEMKRSLVKDINKARKLIFDGEYLKAENLTRTHLLAKRISPRSYQTVGNLKMNFPITDATNYQRDLNLATSVATTKYTSGGVTYTREVISSAADDVMVIQLSADKEGSINFTASLDRPGVLDISSLGTDTLVAEAQAEHNGQHKGVKFASLFKFHPINGSVEIQNNTVSVKDADSVSIFIACNTDYNRYNTGTPLTDNLREKGLAQIAATQQKGYPTFKADAIANHKELFDRVSFTIGEKSELDTLTRLENYKKTPVDNDLEALYFHYGRYLLIGSSRKGNLPANLQGIWSKEVEGSWNVDYHTNINFQMNYWHAEVTNLSECHEPFFSFMERLVPNGQKAAKNLFNCNGFFVPHTTDVWHFVVPLGAPQYGQWVVGGAWCVQHFMEHYRFTRDENFLRNKAYPMLKESSLFFIDWLVPHPKTGLLVSGPSTSPENRFVPDPSNPKASASISMGCAMDQQIIWDTFTNTLEAAEILGIDNNFTKKVEKSLAKLALPKIGSDGRLLEWSEEFVEKNSGHRHISHLFGLHPGRQYNIDEHPKFFEAARKSIDKRLASGGGHTGWSRAWIINFWARFYEGDLAHENIQKLLIKSTHNNLFDMHPPFQIDGNFGGAAGMAEMLLQSHGQYVDLLPALPNAWDKGEITGLVARGGFEIDMKWEGGKLIRASVFSKNGLPVEIRYNGKIHKLDTEKGKSYDLTL